jgi:hypothetical protein
MIMAEEGKGVALAILGIVAVIAVVGLVLLFKGASGQGVYGGAMRQGESEIRPYGEHPGRYVTPVPAEIFPEGAYYDGYKGTDRAWWEYRRNPCPDAGYPAIQDPASVGGRQDCVPSAVRQGFLCCPLGGQAGLLQTGGYE